MNLTFTIPGEPTAQGRPRFSTHGGFVKAYDPEKSRNYKAYVKLLASEAMKNIGLTLTELPLGVEIIADVDSCQQVEKIQGAGFKRLTVTDKKTRC